jgi:pyruvate/2-oxoacid:ferredoxin oxidoreductase beta subunit
MSMTPDTILARHVYGRYQTVTAHDLTKRVDPIRDYSYNQSRYRVLTKKNPEEAERMMQMAQEPVDRRWHTYEHLSEQGPTEFERSG